MPAPPRTRRAVLGVRQRVPQRVIHGQGGLRALRRRPGRRAALAVPGARPRAPAGRAAVSGAAWAPGMRRQARRRAGAGPSPISAAGLLLVLLLWRCEAELPQPAVQLLPRAAGLHGRHRGATTPAGWPGGVGAAASACSLRRRPGERPLTKQRRRLLPPDRGEGLWVGAGRGESAWGPALHRRLGSTDASLSKAQARLPPAAPPERSSWQGCSGGEAGGRQRQLHPAANPGRIACPLGVCRGGSRTRRHGGGD